MTLPVRAATTATSDVIVMWSILHIGICGLKVVAHDLIYFKMFF